MAGERSTRARVGERRARSAVVGCTASEEESDAGRCGCEVTRWRGTGHRTGSGSCADWRQETRDGNKTERRRRREVGRAGDES